MNEKQNNQTSNNEYTEIDSFLEALKNGAEEVIAGLNIYISKAMSDQLKREEEQKQKIQRELAEDHAKTNNQYLEYSYQLAKAQQEKLAKDKLDDEIEVLQKISDAYKKEREEDLKTAEAIRKAKKDQIEALERADTLLNKDGKEYKDAVKAAKKAEKDIKKIEQKQKREKEKQENRKEADSFRFSDPFKQAFSSFIKEVDGGFGNNLKKTSSENLLKAMQGVGKAINEGLNAINTAIDKYASYQTSINARLQGSTAKNFSNVAESLTNVAFSPLLRAEDLYSNLDSIVSEGIASNIQQKALLQTVKDGIATTFNVTEATLKRMVRVQQNDSTAARLGMEAYLTRFLNTYVENTEYLTSTFDNVASSLFEASAVLGASGTDGAAKSAEFEYVVQKWLGTLTGVGLSDQASNNIAAALGQLGSGDVDGLSGNAMQNLLVMAASKSNLSYSKLLNEGLNAKDTNSLMLGLVTYLKEVASSGSNVVKNQLAKVFGVSLSDLISVNNLSTNDINVINKDLLSYDEMYGELGSQMDQLWDRIGISNRLNNAFANFKFQTGMNIASSPAMFALWKITDLIGSVTGGINIPYITALGSGVDLEVTVDRLMKLGLVGLSTLGSIGSISEAGTGYFSKGSALLDALKISSANAKVKSFGGALLDRDGNRYSGSQTSENVWVGQNDSQTYNDAAVNAARDAAQEEVNVKNNEVQDPTVKYLQELDFKNGFDSIVENVAKILGRMPDWSAFNSIDGFN